MNITVSMINPGGNITLLVEGIFNSALKKRINDALLKRFPLAEQVGFYEVSPNKSILEMAGGEFCGNAVRSFASLLLNKNRNTITIDIVGKQIQAGLRNSEIYTEIPIKQSFKSIAKLDENIWKVELEGITHLIYSTDEVFSKEKYLKKGKEILQKYNLLYSSPAAGVMFTTVPTNGEQMIKVNPVVWVKDIETLFYETACGSGTTAIALWLSKFSSLDVNLFEILQPSGSIFTATIKKNKEYFISAQIAGPVTAVFKNKLIEI